MRQLLALIVDRDPVVKSFVVDFLKPIGWEVSQINSVPETLFWLQKLRPDLVLIDSSAISFNENNFFERIKQINPDIFLVLLGGALVSQESIKYLSLGVDDVLLKPLSKNSLKSIVDQLGHKQKNIRENEFPSFMDFTQLIGNSSCMKALRRQIKAVAPRNSWVLLTGENGTGKEVVASNLHLNSNRSGRPFVAVNCAALPENLIESELFGYRKGAFVHAYYSKLGKFELANRGTLFLDEIGDMSLSTQSKILRILQEQSFERLGDHNSISVDVRVIAATNKNLNEEIKKGNFRKDLYYRLNVVPIHVPPLRERDDDVLLLAQYFLEQVALEHRCKLKILSKSTKKLLINYMWPGNVREVKNLMERLSVMVPEEEVHASHLLELDCLGHNYKQEASFDMTANLNLSLKDARLKFEKDFILKRLEGLGGNVSKTADAIGVERSHLYRKLRLYGIDVKR